MHKTLTDLVLEMINKPTTEEDVYNHQYRGILADLNELAEKRLLTRDYIEKVVQSYTKGNFLEAIDYTKQFLRVCPSCKGERGKVNARLNKLMGKIYFEIGLVRDSIKALKEALKLAQDEEEKGDILFELGRSYTMLHKLDKSQYHFEKAVAIFKANESTNAEKLARCYDAIGWIYHMKGEIQTASDYYLKALALVGDENAQMSTLLVHIAAINQIQGNLSDAFHYYFKAIQLAQMRHERKELEMAKAYNGLGTLYHEQKKLPRALDAFRNAANLLKKRYGPKHPELSTCYNNIATILLELGQIKEARETLEKDLKLNLELFGEDHANLLSCYCNLGEAHAKQGEFKQGLAYFQKALKLLEKNFSSDHMDAASIHNHIGKLYLEMKNPKKALENFQIALKILEKNGMIDNPLTIETVRHIGLAYEGDLNNKSAMEYYLKGQAMAEERRDLHCLQSLTVCIADMKYKAGKYEEARKEYTKALEHIDEMEWFDTHELGKINKKIGMCYKEEGNQKEAEAYFRKAAQQIRKNDKEYEFFSGMFPEEPKQEEKEDSNATP